MKPATLIRFTAAAVVALLTALPAFAQRGSADFTRYVALGDSYSAGVSNGSIIIAHQQFSFPAVIARQAGTPDFQQPLVSEPGIPPELRLFSLRPLMIAPKAATGGVPLNLTLPRPYNNLGIPGARARTLLTATGAPTDSGSAQLVLRGIAPAVMQALALQPTFITLWIGGNDVLGAVLAGTPAVLTPAAEFEAAYSQILDTLVAGAPNAGMIAAGVPTAITALPYASTIPPVLVNPATNQPVLGPDNRPIFLVADLGGGEIGQLTPGSLVLLPASQLLATGFGIPAVLAPQFPQLPNVGRPLPAELVLTPSEIAAIQSRAAEINAIIRAEAQERNIAFIDVNDELAEWTEGIEIAGVVLHGGYLVGGLWSYDGFHPTDIGYTLIANSFIEEINEAYGTNIPQASILQFFENNAAGFESMIAPVRSSFIYTRVAWENLLELEGVDLRVSAPGAPTVKQSE